MGQQQVIAGLPGGTTPGGFTVTVGGVGGNFGFNNGSFGSTTPSGVLIDGFSLSQMISVPGTEDFSVTLGNYAGPQLAAFTSITVNNQGNTPVVYTAAGATTYANGTWTWGTGSSPVWTASGVTRNVSVT